MGHHKKRTINSTSQRKPSSPPPPQSSAKSSVSTEMELADSSLIKQECEKALNALRRGNHNKALRLMKESSNKFENSALFHRVHGTIAVKVAGVIDDPNTKHRHFRNAVESARKAALLSPNSIEFSHFYASLMFDTANDGKDYEEVVSECERALAIENPIDPLKDNLNHQQQEDKSPALLTAEARIAQLQGELRGLIQKSNIASISTWMKNLGGPPGEEKFRLIPLRRLSEDPLDSRYFSTTNSNSRRPNEIKKATKTPEERRKEIEVRVAAARLLQQKSEQGRIAEEEKDGSGTQSASLVSGSGASKASERRRNGSSRKNISLCEQKDQVRSFWNSMNSEMKRGLFCVRVCDLMAHFSALSNKDGGQACEVLSEALEYGKMNKTWKFWVCCRCGEKFSQADAHVQHVVQEHMGNLLPKVQSAVPQNVGNEWVEMLVSCSWKPLDLTASVRMLEDVSKPEDSQFSSRENHTEQIDICWDESLRSEEVWEPFSEKRRLSDGCNGGFLESKVDENDLIMECKTCDRKDNSKLYSLPNSWPLSDDIEREKLLEKISSLFQMLLRHKCLAITHLQKVIHFTMEELQGLFPGSQILSSGVDETPLCICFLGASQLKKIIKFLQEVCHACGVGRYPDKVTADDAINHSLTSNCEERIVLNEDGSSLLLDESMLNSDGMSNDVGSLGISVKGVQHISESFLSWIYDGFSSEEQLARWCRLREERSQQGMELLQMLEKEFGHLQSICDRKYEHLGYEEALQGLEELCLAESKRREHVTEFSLHSYDSILKKRRDELVEGENEVMFVSNRMELEAISSVLKEAENLSVNQFGFEEAYGGVTSHLCDLEAGEDDWRSKDYLHQVDTCIEIAIQRQKEQMSIELCKIDARIMRNVGSMQQLELKLELVSALDYRLIILPLVKTFMRAHLEDLAEKDATEKSDAAREAFLAELALDSKKGIGVGNDNSRLMQDKLKDRKKNKDTKRNKDLKASSFNEQLGLSEPFSLAVTTCGDHVHADLVASKSCDNLKALEDEFRRKSELEAEERKLEETLEYQRRLENEAKQKLLAEQHRRKAVASSDNVENYWCDVSLDPSFLVAVHREREQLVSKNFVNNVDGVDRDARSADSYLIQDREIFSGVFPSEQPTVKKGKRQSSTKLLERRYQAPSQGKENENSSATLQKGQVWDQDSGRSCSDAGSKTLRQLQADEDEEERFQADLKTAVRQSLDVFQSRQKSFMAQNSKVEQQSSKNADNLETYSGEGIISNGNEMDSFGAGLLNEIGEYNCFLNVIIQSLWHLSQFREEFLKRSPADHVHVGDPCVVCALYDILTALSVASGDASSEAVTPATLRIALSNLYPESNFFQEGQMNDASEVLAVIFECLHRSFTSVSGGSDSDSVESNCLGSWDCTSPSCIAHTLFGMDVFERMNCYNCGLESRHLKYTSFFHNINASALRTMKVMCTDTSFDELLNLVEMNHQLACDLEVGGCGKLNHIHHILSKPPHIFTTVLGWQNTCESVHDITATLAALATEIDISVLYRGLDPKNVHRLVSVVCYYGQHYHCFAYSFYHERWIMYDDKTVKVIGTWEEVVSMCERGHLQPQVLFYEAAN